VKYKSVGLSYNGKSRTEIDIGRVVERERVAATGSTGVCSDDSSLFYCCESSRKRRAEKFLAVCTKRKTEKFGREQGF